MATNDPDQPAGPTPPPERAGGDAAGTPSVERSALIYCGLCGALNPAGNHYCAACGTTLVDAFHASEGLRVFERPDAASRLIEIVPAGRELDVVEDADAPADYVRVRLQSGRLGYIRLQEVEALAGMAAGGGGSGQVSRAPDINVHAIGCISSTGAIGSLALLLATAALGLALLALSDSADAGILAAVFCVVVLPFLLLTTGFYLYARSRDERLKREAEGE